MDTNLTEDLKKRAVRLLTDATQLTSDLKLLSADFPHLAASAAHDPHPTRTNTREAVAEADYAQQSAADTVRSLNNVLGGLNWLLRTTGDGR